MSKCSTKIEQQGVGSFEVVILIALNDVLCLFNALLGIREEFLGTDIKEVLIGGVKIALEIKNRRERYTVVVSILIEIVEKGVIAF